MRSTMGPIRVELDHSTASSAHGWLHAATALP